MGGVVLKFRTFPDGGREVVCENSYVRKLLKKFEIPNFCQSSFVKTRSYNRSRFQYGIVHIWGLQQPRVGCRSYAVFQTHTSANYYQGVNYPGSIARG